MPVIWRGTTALIEAPNSPEWIYGDRVVMTRTWSGPHAACLAGAVLKGALGTGAAVGMRVAESKVLRQRGGIGVLVIIYETNGQPSQGGGQLPPDEIDIDPNKIERAVSEHPMFDALTEKVRGQIDEAVQHAEGTKRDAAVALFSGNLLAMKLYLKLKKHFTHYALFPPVFKLTQHSWGPPGSISAGGYREAPPSLPVNTPAGVQWIRQGDRLRFNGSTWQLEKSWVGAPEWDPDIYPAS